MGTYSAPLRAMLRTLGAVGLDDVLSLPSFVAFGRDDVSGVLEGFGRFAADVLAPTDQVGDAEGCAFDPASGEVRLPEAIRKAHRLWAEGGWSGLSAMPELGGGGLPTLVGSAVEEMFASANLSLSLNPMLTQGSIHLLDRWGSPAQRERYVPRLVDGTWTGTMCLTEPDAGTDVGALRTRAVRSADGRWEITGTKIFITWGEHDLAENIVHLVLARTSGAPAGTKGISLFAVPKYIVEADGSLGERNAARCVGIERKLGIHGSPTCTMDFDGAVGELVGSECGGMAAMFTMMNAARLSVGLEGLGVGERSYQQALAYAEQRRQGRAPGSTATEPSPIVDHPDVRRMLLRIASGNEAMRLLLYQTAASGDLGRHHPDDAVRQREARRADLLTPIAKAWATDEGVRAASVALQVYGGLGYVEESGIAQRYRDSRIAPIYEGTNGVQAMDLVNRKIVRDGGVVMRELIDDLSADLRSADGVVVDGNVLASAHGALRSLRSATDWLTSDVSDVDRLAGATPYLELAALAVCGGLYARAVHWSHRHEPEEEYRAVAGRFAFYASERLALAPGLVDAVEVGSGALDRAYLR